MTISVRASDLSGSVRAPGSKSVMQRALAACLLAPGESFIRRPAVCDDCAAARLVVQGLGAKIVDTPEGPKITGGLAPRTDELDCGESGLCIRMFTPIAALTGHMTTLGGRGSLLSRPLGSIEAPLTGLGAECRTSGGRAPVRVRGPLAGGSCSFDGSLGSQVLTGLLMATPLAGRDTTIHVSGLSSRPYIDLTIALLADFGVEIENDRYERFFIRSGQTYRPRTFEIEGDWSGGAFLLAAGLAASTSGIRIRGLSPGSVQADRATLTAFGRANADIVYDGDAFIARSAAPAGFRFDAVDCPDLFPPLAAFAAFCSTPSEIVGVHRLAHKESDRASAIAEEFANLGIRVDIGGDTMRIHPGVPSGGVVSSRGDHRIAMAASVLGLRAGGAVHIRGAECVAKSYPDFFDDLESLGADVSVTR